MPRGPGITITIHTKLVVRWQGLFEVLKRISKVDYELRKPGRNPPTKIYHVNLLKL